MDFDNNKDITNLFIVDGNFLNHTWYKTLETDLPKPFEFARPNRSHRDLYCTDEAYTKLLVRSAAWLKLHKWIYSVEFCNLMLAQFRGLYNRVGAKINPIHLPYNEHYREPKQGEPAFESSATPFLYSRMDIGLGLPGYGKENGGRGVHIDNPQRLISGLLYFTNQNTQNGGEFDIYNRKHEMIKRIPISTNLAVISLQCNEARHAVNPVISQSCPRIAVYFAISCNKPIWDR